MADIPGLATVLPRDFAAGGQVGAGRRLRACVVTSEILGPIKNGGIATATSGLVTQLIADGAAVTVLFTLVERNAPTVSQRSWQHWVEQARRQGFTLEHIAHPGSYRDWRRKSWLVKEFLETREFDVVYFNEHHGSGYYAMAASRAGMTPFARQLHCVITHGSIEWVLRTNDQYIKSASDIEMIGMERRSVEWADMVIAPSRYLLNEYERYGWKLPARSVHQPYALIRKPLPTFSDETSRVDELVFFGRLEARKGLWIFCEALRGLSAELAGRTVTFLGRTTDLAGLTTAHPIIAEAARWPFRVRLLTDYDQEEAVAYLARGNRLAIMPSLSDNSPCVIYECIEEGIPFVTGSGSGADELVDARDAPAVFAEPTAERLREKLRAVLRDGASRARPGFDPVENLATWSAWHRHLAADAFAVKRAGAEPQPQVSESTVPLLVTVDSGNQPLAVLLRNVEQHLQRYGQRARHLVWTSRRGGARDLVERILRERLGQTEVEFAVLAPEDVDEVRQRIDASEVVFVTDAALTLEMSFFARAISTLMSGRASVVSCVAATLDPDAGKYWLVDVPGGDLPGVAALGEPAGSGAWAFRTEDMEADVATLVLHDTLSDTIPSSASLGRQMIESCQFAGKTYLLLPLVGAYDRPDVRALPPPAGSHEDLKRSAAKLGLTPSIHGGGATWLGISMFGRRSRPAPKHLVASRLLLRGDHPARSRDFSGAENDMAALSAAFGKLGQAMQIAAGAGASQDAIEELLQLAGQSRMARARIDLLASAARQMASPDAGDQAGDDPETALELPPAVHLDRKRVRLGEDVLHVSGGGSELLEPLVFSDVHLAGHRAISVEFSGSVRPSLRRTGPDHLRISVLDQETGAVIERRHLEVVDVTRRRETVAIAPVHAVVAISIGALCGSPAGTIRIHGLTVD